MIAILDYGSGNLRSAERAFALTGHEVIVTSDPQICADAQGLIVPGVGAFEACMEQLIEVGGDLIISQRVARQQPIFGICVGMQILFTLGEEKNGSLGLGIWPGSVSEISAPILPHIGWNSVQVAEGSRLFEGIESQTFYFVHSFAAKVPVPHALNSTCEYGEIFVAAVEDGSVVATQFHPEKSGSAGVALIKNWARSL